MTDWIREWMLKLEPKIILQIFLLIKPTSLPKISALGSTHGLLRRVKLVKKLFRDMCHKNDKKTCTDHRRTISSSRHKAVVKLRRRESCREDHLGRRWATLQAGSQSKNNLNPTFCFYSVFCQDSPLAISTQKPEQKGPLDAFLPRQAPGWTSGWKEVESGTTGVNRRYLVHLEIRYMNEQRMAAFWAQVSLKEKG